jgi:hypothetical protein
MKLVFTALAAISGLALASSASAATFVPGSPNFTVSGNPFSGPVSANIGNSGIPAGNFTDTFLFTLGQDGFGSGSVTTSTAAFLASTDTDFLSVFVNGISVPINRTVNGIIETAGTSGVPITAGVLNSIVINGFSRGQGSYGGQITFVPVPEPATWAMMLFGFAVVGYSMRPRGKKRARVRFAF